MALKARAELLDLIARIRTVSSPLDRMRVLSDAFKTVRNLTSAERKQLARFVGGRGTEKILARMSRSKDGLRIKDLKNAISRARSEESVTLRRGMDILEDLLEDEEGPAPEPQDPLPSPVPPIEPEPIPVSEVEPVRPRKPRSGPLPPPPQFGVERVATAAGTAAGAAAAAAAAAATAAAKAGMQPAPAAKPVVETPEPTPPEPPAPEVTVEPSRPEPAAPPAPTPPATLPPVPRPAPPLPEARPRPELVADLSRCTSLVARFRALRGRLEEAGDLDLDRLTSLLELFDDGWERRRVLQAFLRAGIPNDGKDAMSLLGTLENDSDRRWCALTLMEAWPEDRRLLDAIVEEYPYPVVRRRARRYLAS